MRARWRSVDAGTDPRRTAARRRAEALGRRAESLAALMLALKAYRIVARRVRTPVGEVDLVVRRGRTVVFVEVKARPDLDEAAASISVRARRRIVAAAEAWLAEKPHLAGFDIRFDAVLFAPGRRPRHVVNAFGEDDWT